MSDNDKRLISERTMINMSCYSCGHRLDCDDKELRGTEICNGVHAFNALEAPQKWIPYKAGDALPVEPKNIFEEISYIVTYDDGAVSRNFRFLGFEGECAWGFMGKIVAFMPFPAPYNEKGERVKS